MDKITNTTQKRKGRVYTVAPTRIVVDRGIEFHLPLKSDEEIINDLHTLVDEHQDNWVRILKAKNHQCIYAGYIDWINYKTPKLDDPSFHIKTKLYWIFNGLTDFKQCKYEKCQHGGLIKRNVVSINIGYSSEYCSPSCAQKSDEHKEKMAEIARTVYHSETISGSPEVRAKVAATLEENKRKDPLYWDKRNAKSQATCTKNHGAPFPIQVPEIKDRILSKARATNQKNLGVDYPLQSSDIHAKIVESNLSTIGVSYQFQNPTIQAQAEELAWSDEAREKRITSLSCHFNGATNAFQTEESIIKATRSIVENFFEYQNKALVKPNFTVDEYLQVVLAHKQYETEFQFFCTECNSTFLAIPFEHCYNFSCARCLKCHPLLEVGISKKEQEVLKFVKEIIPSELVVSNDRTQIINPKTNRNLELDIWIPHRRKAIEFNGDFWHSSEESKLKDATKVTQCKDKNIDILVIKECDWDNDNERMRQTIMEFLT